jgi:hypothetical protein
VYLPWLLAHLNHRSDFDSATSWPGLGQAQRLVKVCHIDLHVAADHLVALNERAVMDDWCPSALEVYGGRGMWGLELIAMAEFGAMLSEPAAHLGILRVAGFLGRVYPGLLQLASPAKQKNVLHC